jgi:N-acetylglutamate synthase/N-acetylornithine aminotransferase
VEERASGRNSKEEAIFGWWIMTSHKLSTIVFAQGWLAEYIDNATEIVEVNEDTMTNDEMVAASNENEYREQARAMWEIITKSLDELRKENTSLENKLSLIDLARNTET